MIENSSRVGSFLMDFSAYPKLTGRDVWSAMKSSERVPGNQTITAMGKYTPHPWQSSSENNPSELFVPGSAVGTSFSGPGNPSGECINGVTDSTCALSLLSNQTWGSRNRTSSALEVNALLNVEGALVAQTTATHAAANHFPTAPWGFKGNEAAASSSSQDHLTSDLGLNQVSQALTSFSGDVQFPHHQGRRSYMELGHSSAFNSTQHLHWSL